MQIEEKYKVLKPRKNEVIKPGVTLIVPLSLVLWACSATAYEFSFGLEAYVLQQYLAIFLATVLVFVILCGAVFVVGKKVFKAINQSRILIILVFVVFSLSGFLLGVFGAYSVVNFSPSSIDLDSKVTFVLTEDAQVSQTGYTAKAKIKTASFFDPKVKLYLPSDAALLEGSEIVASASFSKESNMYAQSSWQYGIVYNATIDSFEEVSSQSPIYLLRKIRAQAISMIEQYCPNNGGLIQALVCGYRNTIKEDGLYDAFKTCGLAHLVAVSGAHLAIVTAVFCSLLKGFNVSRKITFTLSVLFVCAYLVFAGVPISALRASVMILISSSSWIFGRRNASLNALAVCICAFLIFDPVSSVSVSLFLSAGSTFGIILFASLIASWMACKSKKLNDFVVSPISLTLASNIETTPYSIALFSQLPLISFVSNIVAAPIFSIACTLGLLSVVLALLLPFASAIILIPADFVAGILSSVVAWMSKIPYACIACSANVYAMIALSVVLSVILWVTFPKFKLRSIAIAGGIVCLAVACVIFVSPRLSTDEIRMLDVGQGDSTLIRSDGVSVLIDTGNHDTLLKSEIGEAGIYTLDAVFISHADSDHCGSLASLADFVNIKRVYLAADALDCTCNNCTSLVDVCKNLVGEEGLYGVNVGDEFGVGRFKFTILSPSAFSDEGGNADSLVMSCAYDYENDGQAEWLALFTGDAETETLTKLMNAGLLSDIDVLKVGHHGSKVSLSSDILDVLKPEVALIGVGATNRYGHPTQTVLDLLANANSEVYRTDVNGTISITFSKNNLCVNPDSS
jgi:competence protein ComEC